MGVKEERINFDWLEGRRDGRIIVTAHKAYPCKRRKAKSERREARNSCMLQGRMHHKVLLGSSEGCRER